MPEDSQKNLGFIELPSEYDPLQMWVEARSTLLGLKQTAEVKDLLATCNRVIAEKRTRRG